MAVKLKNAQKVEDRKYGVCLWKMNDGKYLGDEDGNLLSLEGWVGDFVVENKMRTAVRYYIGDEVNDGKPHWIPGSRKITEDEYAEQVDRLAAGLIPDPVEAVRQAEAMGRWG